MHKTGVFVCKTKTKTYNVQDKDQDYIIGLGLAKLSWLVTGLEFVV